MTTKTPAQVEQYKNECFARWIFKHFDYDQSRIRVWLNSRRKKKGELDYQRLNKLFKAEWAVMKDRSKTQIQMQLHEDDVEMKRELHK